MKLKLLIGGHLMSHWVIKTADLFRNYNLNMKLNLPKCGNLMTKSLIQLYSLRNDTLKYETKIMVA